MTTSRLPLLLRPRAALSAFAVVTTTFSLLLAQPSSSRPMSSAPEFTSINVPARIAGLSFSYLRPADFSAIELPAEIPDFEQPAVFMPLEVAMANYGTVFFSVGARPAYGDGTLEDWAGFLARELKMKVISLRPGTVAGMGCIIVEATQASEVSTMRLRSVFLEDGTRFLNLTLLAPEALWASVEPTLQFTLSSFRLDAPRGSTVAVTRADAEKAAANVAAAAPAPETEPTPPESDSVPTPAAELALASDAATLDPAHPINTRLRDNGVGLTPRLLDANADEKVALIGAGAVASTFRVPFGWHVIDDGQRTLVFDADGHIQVSLNLRAARGDAHALLRRILDENKKQQPQIDPLFQDFAPDLPGLVLRNYRDGNDVLVQVFVVRELRDDGLAHVARVTAAPEHMTRAMNLTELILRSLGVEAVLAAR